MTARVFFLNRFYWPDETATAQLLTDLASDLAARGIPVTVITAQHSPSPVVAAAHRGVSIERVRTTRWGRRRLAGRVFDFLSYHLLAAWRLGRDLRPGDVAVAMTDPPLLGIPVAAVAALRRARVVHWVQDIYPEIAAAVTGRRGVLLLQPLRDRAWRAAAACVVPGEQMARTIAGARVPADRIHVCANWAPGDLQAAAGRAVEALRAAWGLTGRFVVAYSGNLGRVHDLEPLLDVAARLQSHPRLALVFIGEGAQRRRLELAAQHRGLVNVRFFAPQPREQLALSLSLADVHLVTLLPGCERFVYPSKLYGAAAVGRPILAIAAPDSELAATVRGEGLGQAFARTEVDGIAQALVALAADPARCQAYGRAAHEFAANGRVHAVTRWLTVLAPVLGPASSPLPAPTP